MHFTLKLMDTANLDVQNNSGNNIRSIQCGVAPRTILAPTYDGQTPWSSYKKQFEAAPTLCEEDRNRYRAVISALELQFGDEHLKKVFTAQVKTRIQKARESLQEFEADCYVLHAPTHHHPSKRGLRQKHHLMP
ncbi:hypothetical protein Zmor_015321 [Zophobas morio]|uniref:Uncharacterized protein n=1 Tax=Zophobas morio TaxID=2755281 RepID=A0AA38MHF0_9CUCU|nr:hypothetical protein Zmor_015321 [Zophobas morio]